MACTFIPLNLARVSKRSRVTRDSLDIESTNRDLWKQHTATVFLFASVFSPPSPMFSAFTLIGPDTYRAWTGCHHILGFFLYTVFFRCYATSFLPLFWSLLSVILRPFSCLIGSFLHTAGSDTSFIIFHCSGSFVDLLFINFMITLPKCLSNTQHQLDARIHNNHKHTVATCQ